MSYLTQNQSVLDGINASVEVLRSQLEKGNHIYGVNTGFGGSADSRTDNTIGLQAALLQLLQAGVLTSADTGTADATDGLASLAMPASWVKGIMLVRCNQNARGHSAVSLPVLHSILALLRNKITPIIPLRGSVSASGDLMPLAYIAGALEGSPDVYVQVDAGQRTQQVMSSQDALRLAGEEAITLGPKEGLGLVNGTAASVTLASLAIYEANNLAVFTQVLTAMACEALLGTTESFHPFIGEVRPHPGQVESARNILKLLGGSLLVKDKAGGKKSGLIQPRYALRTASQWIGPQLEDLLLATRQVGTELNSSSDNPLVDSRTGEIYSGGNFQGKPCCLSNTSLNLILPLQNLTLTYLAAASITSAMEKTRMSLQMFGKLLFSQTTEMIDSTLSNGLTPNLVADNPSLSFTMKGVDISMASYMSELAHLANPISSHVQATEMHNQSINSMALVSSRLTMQAVELLSLMSACSLYICCQALDIRVMHLLFLAKVHPVIETITAETFPVVMSPNQLADLDVLLREKTNSAWFSNAKLDIDDRIRATVDTLLPLVLTALANASETPDESKFGIFTLERWKAKAITNMEDVYGAAKGAFLDTRPTPSFLGAGSRAMYAVVREELGVPFHKGFVEHPKTIGSWISVLYEALRSGRFQKAVMSVL